MLGHPLCRYLNLALGFGLQLFKLLLHYRNTAAGRLPFKGGCSVVEKGFLPSVQERGTNLFILAQLRDGHFVYELLA